MRKKVSDIIKKIILENHNITCTEGEFSEKFLLVLEENLDIKINVTEGDFFVDNEHILDYLEKRNKGFLLPDLIRKTVNSFIKDHNIKEFDIVKGLALSRDQSDKSIFFEILNHDNVTAILPSFFFSPSDDYSTGKEFYLLVEKVLLDSKVNLVVSRNKGLLVKKLVGIFCKEIEQEKISILNVARYPGMKTKILVQVLDQNCSGILSLLGKNSYIVNSIYRELNEIIQIFEFIPDKLKETYISLMYPVDVQDIEIFDDTIVYYVKENDLARAIGKRGSNVKLTSMLIKKKIDIRIK